MATIRKVYEKMHIIPKVTVLVCDYFGDDEITNVLTSNKGIIEKFYVERVYECFSKAKTRHINVYEADADEIEYISFI